MNRIRVLVVDDSALMRKLISEMLSACPQIEVVGRAKDGLEAISLVEALRPDVLTLDVEMPNLNGVETLKRLANHPTLRTVMLSSVTLAGAEMTMNCLSLGAFDFVSKPSGATSVDINKVREELTAKVLLAYQSLGGIRPSPAISVVQRSDAPQFPLTRDRLVVIGCSTGGPRALLQLIPALPGDLHVPIIIVQHMPENFTKPLADRLNQLAKLQVKEVEEGDRLTPGQVLLAKGGFHLEFDDAGVAHLTKTGQVHGVRPSIDVTIASLVAKRANRMVGVALTGMGKDGAAGFKAIFDKGGYTIVEDESTCAVYGMPKIVVESGAASEISPLGKIAQAIADAVSRPSAFLGDLRKAS